VCYLTYIQNGGSAEKSVRLFMYMEGNVGTVIAIPPKSDTHRHRRVDYTLTYLPPTKQWKWSFVLRVELPMDGIRDTYADAMQDARDHIDRSQGAYP
jgi:hypothetical protein